MSEEWIITPNLKEYRDRFIAHIEAAENTPILITGPRGTGKSLFLEIAKEHLNLNKGCGYIRINCANFKTELARSELFGHIKGAFTGANEHKEGWIKKADGNILILEEIGTLSQDVQEQLLTFIENGEFHKVGSTTAESANVQIIAVTNKSETFRKDFLDRFFEFTIPPLCERREDVLYYLAWHYPDLISELTPPEVFAILAYHWPGNAREVFQISKSIKKEKIFEEMQNDSSKKENINKNQDILGYYDLIHKTNKYQDTELFNVLTEDLKNFGNKLSKFKLNRSFIKNFSNNTLNLAIF